MPAAEKFFLNKIRSNMHRTGQYAWGSFYGTWGHAFSSRMGIFWMFVSFFMMLVFLCYFPNSSQMLYVIPVMILCQFQLPVFSSLTIFGGRRERFAASYWMVVILAVCVLAGIWTLAGASHLIAPAMPVFNFSGTEFRFIPATFDLWFVPLMAVPILFTMQLFFSRSQMAMITSVMIVFLFLMLGGILSQQKYFAQYKPWITSVSCLLVVISWAVFILQLKRTCSKRSIGPA